MSLLVLVLVVKLLIRVCMCVCRVRDGGASFYCVIQYAITRSIGMLTIHIFRPMVSMADPSCVNE